MTILFTTNSYDFQIPWRPKFLSFGYFLILLTALVLFTFTDSFSQETGLITGKIVDSQTGEELIGANVILDGTTNGAASDIEGNYQIRNISPGIYSLTASMIGYAKLNITDIDIKPGSILKIDRKVKKKEYPKKIKLSDLQWGKLPTVH